MAEFKHGEAKNISNTLSWNGASEKDMPGNFYTKKPYIPASISDGKATDTNHTYSSRGVWDLGNLLQFAPYESGYCFLAVINGPQFMQEYSEYTKLLQYAFIGVLEREFRGIDGIEDLTLDTLEVTDGISTILLPGKSNQQSGGTFSMVFTEKTGSLLTKYTSTYIKLVRDTRSQAKVGKSLGAWKEVFNLLYVITDATCLRVEKAFLILNAFPTSSVYSELYNSSKGDVSIKEISIPFAGTIIDGNPADRVGRSYIEAMVNLGDSKTGAINLNSMNYNWSYMKDGTRYKTDGLKFE